MEAEKNDTMDRADIRMTQMRLIQRVRTVVEFIDAM